ncbi:BTB/POZ domain-containing protein 16 [Carassius carassius]|uniref:BTB/POZ domain-containing protein 16 n=1 Tax=Carassius carassius TaxID=217509 RepID=UPI0028685BC8|nr:BTB/POZ domain-containing protein 16 [Carassius carassius]XP_059387930.1 BTB/POZ domain-containing protein 16 [Carassius carassius]
MHNQWSHLSSRNMPFRPHSRLMFITSHNSHQISNRSVWAHSLCQRTQAGHTNRWQLAGALGSDLLGQAQFRRAEEFGDKSANRKIKSADPMTLHWHEDATSCPQSPLPQLIHPLSASRRTRLCKDVTWSSKLDTPEEQFYILSRKLTQNAKPDAVLECLGVRWELHCSVLSHSDILSKLYTNSKRQRDVQLQERAATSKHSKVNRTQCERGLVYRKWHLSGPLILRLPVKDASINKEALSFALRTLYDPEERPSEWGEAVLSTAALLGMSNLLEKCLKEMLANISSLTVCSFHRVSCKLKETVLQRACERWLELFLVTELSFHIKLRDLPFDLLLKTLLSPRLFTSNEYEVLRAVLCWLYLQLNPLRQTLPAHSTIITFFSKETAVFLEQPQGQKYIAIFQALRIHGITEWQHLQELQNIRVLPESWLLHILSNHYHTLYSGGDMVLTDFSKQAIRFGMMFDREQVGCTQTISIYGFYFLLQAAKMGESDTYSFSIERLKHWDPAVCQSSVVSRPYSVRSDRSVCYHITVQSYASGEWQEHSSGAVSQEFGLCKRRSRSKPFQIEGLSSPILVTFALAFPF